MMRNHPMQSLSTILRHLFRSDVERACTNLPDSLNPHVQDFFRGLPDAYRSGTKGKPPFDSMTTANELLFLERYARHAYSGRGKIVDLGCWLGATSAALADGLSGGPYAEMHGVVEAYDLFEWREWMNPIKEAIGAKVDFRVGECFHSHVQKALASYERLVSVHKADLTSYRPPDDWQIEFLFIDAMKSWHLATSIAAHFFPHLMPGKSLVVQQDFAFHHPVVSTNHLLMWHLKDFFAPLHHVPDSCSMVFSTTRTPSLSDIPEYSPHSFNEREVCEAYCYCVPMVQRSMRSSLFVAKLCHGLLYHQRMTVTTAVEELRGHRLSQEMQETIVQSLRDGVPTASPDWADFAHGQAAKLTINTPR